MLLTAVVGVLAACASTGTGPQWGGEAKLAASAENQLQILNRVTWGATSSSAQQMSASGTARYIEQQLRPAGHGTLPPEVQAQIDALTISQGPLEELMLELEQRRKDAAAIKEPEQKKPAQQAYQQALTRLAREAASRAILRALYSPNQLQEQMTWFWMNHFNVFQYKNNVRAMLGDYEEQAIRPHALGRFRALLGATARHPAMIRYLDNAQNAANRINENYARELMELHTLGVNGGYTQRDVQELARILTGIGINLGPNAPKIAPDRQSLYVRQGIFEFNPNRHDFGDKSFLGETVKGRGLAEVDEALDRLARHPSTARFVSRKLAVYFVADDPPPALVERMAQRFLSSDGDIADTLRVMFRSPEFADSLGRKFKDPVHYVISAVRLAYDERPILNTTPVINWLNRMGQGLYNRETPDGYPLTQASWASPGQMTTRFEIARAIGSGSAGLFRSEGPQPTDRPAFPQLSNALYHQSLQKTLRPETLKALNQATSPQEWNTFLLSSPEFMNR
ncbi:MAG TPA: DUF1800 domain-containing protein [Burkholderiales bacterium]|nr:DUF1800 domain-containing protein [Burkholderiales bacterium]